MTYSEPAAPDLLAAQLAVHALAVLASSDGRHTSVILDGARLTPEEAVRRLAGLKKPVVCRGTVVGEALSVVTRPLAGEEESEWQHWIEATLPENDRFIREMYGGGTEPRILFTSASDHLLLPLEVYNRWQRDYQLPGIAFSLDSPKPGQSAFGAQAVLTIWRSAEDRFAR